MVMLVYQRVINFMDHGPAHRPSLRQPTCPPPQTSRLSICDVLAEVRNVSSQQKRIKEIESPSRSAWITRPPAVHTNCINCQIDKVHIIVKLMFWSSSDHLRHLTTFPDFVGIPAPLSDLSEFPHIGFHRLCRNLRMASNTCRWMPLGPTEGDGSGDPEARSWCNWPQLMTHQNWK